MTSNEVAVSRLLPCSPRFALHPPFVISYPLYASTPGLVSSPLRPPPLSLSTAAQPHPLGLAFLTLPHPAPALTPRSSSPSLCSRACLASISPPRLSLCARPAPLSSPCPCARVPCRRRWLRKAVAAVGSEGDASRRAGGGGSGGRRARAMGRGR
ncbi:hypothetical protein CPC08DRAFT_715706 [Agrocybe pediades]|nr:hypothetical protein CPC08DRAFT_715706 [Agrocybe pediades]